MRLVGASESFIKAPFYIEGLLQGLVGAVAGIGVLFVCSLPWQPRRAECAGRDDGSPLPGTRTAVVIILVSMLAGSLGCYVSLKSS